MFDDANIESAVNASIAGIFGATGQSCVAGSRLYLHEDIADEFLEKMIVLARQIIIGDPLEEDTQMGPLCTLGQLKNIQAEVEYAEQEALRYLPAASNRKVKRSILRAHNYRVSQPRFANCRYGAFGPVLCVQRFKTEEEVLSLANDTEHGLAAGVFTQNSARSLRMAGSVRAGIVWVNTYRVVSPIAEFGGVKGSGYGRESGFQAIYDYTRPKTIWMNTSDDPMSNPFVMR